MKREALDRPFEAAIIRERPGQGGKLLAYVEGHEYIRRLNEAFDGQWSFRILSHEIHDRELVVIGELTAEGLTKMAFGGAPMGVELGDSFKIAATDALKKASTLFGVGLHLYDDEASARARDARTGKAAPEQAQAAKRVSAPPPARVDAKPVKRGGARRGGATAEQLAEIVEEAKRLGWGREQLEKWTVEIFEGLADYEYLSASQAARAIEYLSAAQPSQSAMDRPTPEQGDRLRELARSLGLSGEQIAAECHRATGVRPAALTSVQAANWIEALEQALEQAEGAAS